MKNLSRILGFSAAVLAIGLLTSTASAQPGRGKGGPAKKGAQEKGRRGANKGGAEKGGPGEGRGQRSPEEMVKRMIEQFDKNGDKALDAKELMAMFTQMRERGGRGGQGGADQRGGQQRGPGRGGFGRGKGGPGGKGGDQKGGKGKGRPDFNQ